MKIDYITKPSKELLEKAKALYNFNTSHLNNPLSWDCLDADTRIHWLIYAKGYGSSESRHLRRP